MTFQDINARGLVLLGCGKMGSALLEGWLKGGVKPDAVWVTDPAPSDWVKASGVHVNKGAPDTPAVLVIAVKPQIMDEALASTPGIASAETLVVSVAAGTPIARFEQSFGIEAPIVRTMPNTPAAIGQGITAIVGNAAATPDDLDLADALMSAVGATLRLDGEDQMDAVTAVSGSGPAYVFHLIETLCAAGVSQGLPEEMAMTLAKATVRGAGALAARAEENPTQLRINVTSPKGTTEAALGVLMDKESGFPGLMKRAVAAAADRSRELRS